MKYICHKPYHKKCACGRKLFIKTGQILDTVGAFIVMNDKAVCNIKSEDAYMYFARNDDSMGIKRGELTHLIAYSYRRPNKDNSYRFTPEEIEMLKTDYIKYLRQDCDALIFNYDFFNADIEVLEDIRKRLEVRKCSR